MKKNWLLTISIGVILQGCSYLDIIPDNTATLEHSFANDITTRNYLFTCYSGLPNEGDIYSSPVFLSGDEYWSWEALIKYPEETDIYLPWMIARGEQNTNAPYLNEYEGKLWKTIRQCNTFIERVDGVKGLKEMDARRWKAEAKVIKAYCHFYLMRMYGPIPLIKESLSIDAQPEEVRLKRSPWDECVNYVTQLLDEASPELPVVINNRIEELGRFTRPIALTLKAKILVTSASPQFNGNPYYSNFKNKSGEMLFGAADLAKWEKAATACKEAIILCEEQAGMELYKYVTMGEVPDPIRYEHTIRGSVTDKSWNDELIWGSVTSPGYIQKYVQAYLNPDYLVGGHMHTVLGVNMKVAKQYYTSNGVPMEEDKTWSKKNIETLRTATSEENKLIRGTTAEFNFDREPRFYASLGFDRGVWYGSGRLDNNPFIVQGLFTQTANKNPDELACVTGYWAKKLVNMESAQTANTTYTAQKYAWPVLRLADLYLLYAEALNEAGSETPGAEVYTYLNKVRERAGLKGVKESWKAYSTYPAKPESKEGMREIIQRERLIELSLEGHRFWDLRRWLLATDYFAQPVTGWDCHMKETADYYHETTIATQKFTARDYLWPISISLLDKNPNLVQTIGW